MSSSEFHTNPDRLLTADEVAGLLHVTKSWVYDQTRQHRMPHVRLGRYVRYRRSAVDGWIAQLEEQSIRVQARRPS
jgi:excisionase family DNA binding protein